MSTENGPEASSLDVIESDTHGPVADNDAAAAVLRQRIDEATASAADARRNGDEAVATRFDRISMRLAQQAIQGLFRQIVSDPNEPPIHVAPYSPAVIYLHSYRGGMNIDTIYPRPLSRYL